MLLTDRWTSLSMPRGFLFLFLALGPTLVAAPIQAARFSQTIICMGLVIDCDSGHNFRNFW